MAVAGFMTMPREVKFRLEPRGSWVTRIIDGEGRNVEEKMNHLMGVVDGET
ncbi:unnamed protein product [Penicillium salamii]|uniref:Uncharacterized protein n=1 Tax=Penicillium salamii TaxID=1612424 RepID=A0A9W4ICG5_9EURO|nr:unnamed protein product [Penicillium salamii]CAG8257432.1 unnamed protein product [Penicillium salamii]CAG8281169.1 unnamed protein product [Penicillium salamii]CAG8299617.1 unnamed protein product [Penicillium salamii]CAG8391251.1 unnamed protein product [Penicillium salamii]